MLDNLLWLTAILLACSFIAAYVKFQDVFHPLLYMLPMAAFIYVYMPMKLVGSGEIFSFVTEEQLIFVQSLAVLMFSALIAGCFQGSGDRPGRPGRPRHFYDKAVLHRIAYILASLGLAAWLFTIVEVGGIMRAYGRSYGGGWSSYGYIREAVYLLLAAVLLLMSREGFDPKNATWRLMVALCSIPWLMKGLLGARRGPTFVILVTLTVSWYFAHRMRPKLIQVMVAGFILGGMLLFLVTNRSRVHLGAEVELDNFEYDVTAGVTKAGAANEYIFGAGCISASRQTGTYFWGKRILAQFVVRPIPKQLWPNKYADFGVSELERNAGVASTGLLAVMGWSEVPGAAAALVADLWVEFSWLAIAAAWGIGWTYGYVWKKAVTEGGYWVTQYMIFTSISIYLVTQGIEAVLFRLIILSVPTLLVWRQARIATPSGRRPLPPAFAGAYPSR